MADVKLLVREDGIFVENPETSRDFIDELKKELDEIGAEGFDESEFLASIKGEEHGLVKIATTLAKNHDAEIFFNKSEENPDFIIATIVPPSGNGKQFNAEEIFHHLKDAGFTDVSVDEDKIHNAVERQSYDKESFTFVIGERTRPQINVVISKDQMSASVTIKKFMEGQKILPQDILQSLNDTGVTKGILEEAVNELAAKNVSVESVEVAKGKKPIDGKPGEIIYFFDARKENRGPQIDVEGNADFHRMNLFENVKKGMTLCKIVPPGKGNSGCTVTGEEIPSKPGKETTLPMGANTEVDPVDPTKLVASIDGYPRLMSGKITIDNVMNIKGDVGLSTGDIEFVGSVNISGGITDGFTVIAGGDILINGPCESCRIESGGDVIFHKGMRAGEPAIITARGNVNAAFMEGVTVRARGDVIIREYCYHCDIEAGNSVKVLGKTGFITGGKVIAGFSVIARRLGSQACPRTEIAVDPLEEWKDGKKPEVSDEINDPSESENSIPDESCTKDVQVETVPFVGVINSVHPNVIVSVSRAKTIVKEELAEVKFIYKLGKVEMIPYEHEKKQE